MRKLIITRGPQAVGKSSFLRSLGLAHHTLSSDALRLMIASPVLTPDGGWGISQEQNSKVWGLFADMAKQRLSRGETLALDAMFRLKSDMAPFIELAQEHGYEVLIADFSAMSFEQGQAQNNARPEIERISEGTLSRTYKNFASVKLEAPESVKVEKWDPADGHAGLTARVKAWLRVPVVDFSAYQRVVHIGDLQGCLSVMTQPGGPFEQGFRDDTRYIFMGDLLDRGIENGALLKWLIPHVLSRSNIDVVWGNHEDHLFRFSKGQEAVSHEFRERTLPQLVAAGVTPQDAAALMARVKPALAYVWRGQKVIATHAGLPGLPPVENGEPQWHLLSMQQLSRGSGNYSDPIDQQWERNTDTEIGRQWIQIHGHRNHGAKSIQATPRSFNLEDEVEFGGNLRLATLSDQGWSGDSYRNSVFATWRSRFERPKKTASKTNGEQEMSDAVEKEPLDVSLPIPDWIKTPSKDGTRLPDEVLSAMRAHSGVMEKPMPSFPHISSLNFTRDVFFDKKWDDVVVKARGLFFSTESGEVVARGYEKFFNIGERPETEIGALESSLAFPITGYVKENGFLGNIGYDAKTDSLFIASKSTEAGDFASWLREIFNAQVGPESQERLRRYLRDAEASMAFEVVDPERDPHMIDYDKAHLVLLDVFHRSSVTEKLNHEDLKKVGERFGMKVKERAFVFKTFQAFDGWLKNASKDLAYRYSGGQDIEGIVFEDQAGFQTKAKLPHYSFWKHMRSAKDRLARLTVKKQEIEAANGGIERQAQAYAKVQADTQRCLKGDDHPLALKFMAWCSERPLADLSKSILDLRREFNEQVGISPEDLGVRWTRFDPSEKEVPKVKAPKSPKP